MQNITLQTSDSDLNTNEVIGRLAFAASNDSSGSDAILVAASIYARAESEFTVSSNSTSLVFATASSEAATNKLRITSEGHFIPFTSGQYDLGSSAYPFRALYVDTSVYSPSGSFDYLVFNTGIADADLTTGQVAWGNEAGTLEIGLTDDTKIAVGQSVLFRVKNSTGSTLSKGQAVYATGVLGGGQIIQVAKFAADNSVDEVRFIGLMTDDLANGDDGFVNHFGHIKHVDLRTSNTALNPNGETWAAGDILYVDDGTAGGLTKNAPQDDIYVAIVLEDGQNGELFVRITDPGHMTDLHDVNLTGLVDNNLMVWNSGSNYWEPTTSMTFNGTTLHTDTDGITAIFGRNNAQTQGGKVRIYVDDNDTAGSVQAIKAFNAKTTGTNYGINATAHGLGATKNVGLYGWAAQATTNWGLWVNAGYGIFDDKVGIKTQSPAFDLHVNGSGYFTNDVYYGGDLVIAGDLFVNGSGIIGDIGIVDNTISSLSGNLLLFPECSGYVGVNTDDPNAMLHVYSATSGDNIFNVEGTNGSLFSVVDNLSGTLMSVNTIAGLPVLEVNSDYSVTAGRFNQNDFVISSGGRVGIGAGSPVSKLDVSGVITASGGDSDEWNQSYDWVAASGGLPYVTGVGTANQVAFFNGTNGITSESNLYWDSTNNRLGIQASSPQYPLHVGGTIYSLGLSVNPNADVATSLGRAKIGSYIGDVAYFSHYDYGNSTDYALKQHSAGSTNVNSPSGQSVALCINNIEQLFVNSAGNVGIGTVSPSAKLDVNGSVNVANDVIVGGNVTINGTTVTANADSMQVKDPIITLGLASGNVITNDTYDRGLALVTNNGTAFMGWDNSADKFVMLSSGVATNSSGNYDAGTWGNLEMGNLTLNGSIALNSSSYNISWDNGTEYIGRSASSDAIIIGVQSQQKAIFGAGATVFNEPGNDQDFRVESSNNITMLFVDAGNDRVGIGTAPSYTLDVSGSGRFTGAAVFESTIDAASLGTGEDNSVVILDSDGKLRTDEIDSRVWGTSLVDGAGSANHVAFWSDANTLTYDSTQLYWDSSTNKLGIGTSSPQVKTHIVESDGTDEFLRFSDTSAGSISAVRAYQQYYLGENTTRLAYLGITSDQIFDIATTTSGGTIRMLTGSNQLRMQITSAGNVGIGTASPVSKLDVSGVITANGGNSNEWNQAYDWIQNSGLDGTGAASGVAFWTDSNTLSNDSALIWDSTNNKLGIGIANTAAGTPLFVYTADATNFTRIESATQQGILFSRSLVNSWLVGRDGNNKFHITYNNAFGTNDRISIDTAGNVGIGTTSPTQKLDVRYPAGGGMALLKSTDTTDGLLLGDMTYSASNAHQGMKHAAMTGVNDYMIMSAGTATSISAADGQNVFIKAGGNNENSLITLSSTEVVINDESSSNDFRVESNNNANMLFVDGGSDMVGIGTGSPAQVLHVYGGTISSERSATAGSPPSTYLSDITTAPASGIGSFHTHRFNTASTPDFAGKYGILQTSSSTNDRQFQVYVADSVTPKMVVNGNGNVGIGTTSPSEKLHVYGTAAGDGALIGSSKIGNWENDASYASFTHNDVHSTATSYALLQSNNGTTFLNSASSTSLSLRINNVNSLVVDSSRSVRMLGDSTNNTWGSASPTLAIKRSNGAPYMSFHSDGGTRLGYLQFHAFADNIINGENYQDFVFNTNSLERMRIHKDGYVNFSNYLRIDRTNDERGIVFEDSGGTDSCYITVNDGQGNFNFMLGVNHDGNRISSDDGLSKLLFSGHGADGEISLNAGTIGTAGTSAVYNIGLSLSSSDQKLRIGNPNDNIGLDIGAGNIIADVDGDLITRYLRARDANGIQIGDDSDTLGIFVKDGGNVGIGTSTPSNKLHIHSTTSYDGILLGGSPAPNIIFDGTNTLTNWRIGNAGTDGNNFTIATNTGSEQHITITPSGYVGIGTASPFNKLHVQGSSDQLRLSDGTLAFTVGYNNNYLRFKNSAGDTHAVINWSSGNVGIGTTTPSQKLDVVGSGNFSGDVTITGHLSAATKSFLINHPTEEGKKLQYGSLESPYHGVRLTGRSAVQNGVCVVKLPEYISELVHNNNDINIQITNIKHGKILYVDDINIDNNEFTVKTDAWLGTSGLEFFWTFTAVRKDVKELQVEF